MCFFAYVFIYILYHEFLNRKKIPHLIFLLKNTSWSAFYVAEHNGGLSLGKMKRLLYLLTSV